MQNKRDNERLKDDRKTSLRSPTYQYAPFTSDLQRNRTRTSKYKHKLRIKYDIFHNQDKK